MFHKSINWVGVLVEAACQKSEIPIDLHGNAEVRIYFKPKNWLNLLMFLLGNIGQF